MLGVCNAMSAKVFDPVQLNLFLRDRGDRDRRLLQIRFALLRGHHDFFDLGRRPRTTNGLMAMLAAAATIALARAMDLFTIISPRLSQNPRSVSSGNDPHAAEPSTCLLSRNTLVERTRGMLQKKPPYANPI